jgi:hypothetical protein
MKSNNTTFSFFLKDFAAHIEQVSTFNDKVQIVKQYCPADSTRENNRAFAVLDDLHTISTEYLEKLLNADRELEKLLKLIPFSNEPTN